VVCRANVARSPLAAALLAEALAGTGIEVASAGVQATLGAPPARGSVELAARRGLNLTAHASQPVSAGLVSDATLVVTMSEAHRDICAHLAPGVSARTFTLRELDRLASAADAPPGEAPTDPAAAAAERPTDPDPAAADTDLTAPDVPAPERLRRLVEAAHRARPWASPPQEQEDIPDPMGRDWEHWFALADELEHLIARFATRLTDGTPAR
jgi:protein-tyrosine phosphatase